MGGVLLLAQVGKHRVAAVGGGSGSHGSTIVLFAFGQILVQCTILEDGHFLLHPLWSQILDNPVCTREQPMKHLQRTTGRGKHLHQQGTSSLDTAHGITERMWLD